MIKSNKICSVIVRATLYCPETGASFIDTGVMTINKNRRNVSKIIVKHDNIMNLSRYKDSKSMTFCIYLELLSVKWVKNDKTFIYYPLSLKKVRLNNKLKIEYTMNTEAIKKHLDGHIKSHFCSFYDNRNWSLFIKNNQFYLQLLQSSTDMIWGNIKMHVSGSIYVIHDYVLKEIKYKDISVIFSMKNSIFPLGIIRHEIGSMRYEIKVRKYREFFLANKLIKIALTFNISNW